MGPGVWPHNPTPGNSHPPAKYKPPPRRMCGARSFVLGIARRVFFFWWMMLVSQLVQLKWKRKAPSQTRCKPLPEPPTVRYIFIEGEGTFFPRLRSRQQTQNPLPREQLGGSGRGGRLLCLLSQRIWPMCSCLSGEKIYTQPPALLILSVMSSGLELSVATERPLVVSSV